VIGGEEDAGGGGRGSCNCHEIMELEGLVDGGEGVEAVVAEGAYGEAEVDFAVGADTGGHQAGSRNGVF